MWIYVADLQATTFHRSRGALRRFPQGLKPRVGAGRSGAAEAAPLQNKVKTRVFPQAVKPCLPVRDPLEFLHTRSRLALPITIYEIASYLRDNLDSGGR